MSCTGTFVLDRGQITAQGLFDYGALLLEVKLSHGRSGKGIYRNAGDDCTVQVPVNVPNQTDANFVFNVTTGS
jgi:hypothetical protein